MIGLLFLAAIAVFFLGLILGFLCSPKPCERPKEKTTPDIPDSAIAELRKAYNNFLTYDGDEQP